MPMPPSQIKINKNGVKLIDNVDATQYLLKELIRAANRDVGKFIVKIARAGMPKRTGRARKAIQFWSRKDGKLEIGYKKGVAFYARFFELGSKNTPKLLLITNAVEQNVPQIRAIQAQYLSGITKGDTSAIDEEEVISDD